MSKKALIAWDKLCCPKTTGGLKFMDIQTWNNAAICKLFLSLSKKDKLWVRWVHIFYVKGSQVSEAQAKQASWVVQKSLKAKKNLVINWLQGM